ncbi:hypothetical protein D3C87_1274400 [compost metagenome]
MNFRALASREHHHRHDAFAIDRRFRRTSYPDRAILELTGDADKFCGRTGVQAQLVDDFDFQSRHRDVNPLAEVAVADLDVLQGLLQGLAQAFGQVDGAVMPARATDGNSDISAVTGRKAR